MTISELALQFAISQIGQQEIPKGSNRGPMVDEYQERVGLDLRRGSPWCMAFIFWCFDEAAKEMKVYNPAIRSAGCLDVWHRANKLDYPKQLTATKAKTDWSRVKPGMIFILETNKNTGAGHTGIIKSVNPLTGILNTIEGNSNEDGSREGWKVALLKRRRINSINIGFIDYNETVPLTQ